ncbi:fimbrial assembly protein [Pseudomonas gregormendelii]|uniref:Fimbrial assembly protein n=1 Tax=Pseudomonas gregormendelii TaxID=1628277 RepID=A0ABS3AGQ6_9PSED|nr:CS1 type fimbrial major subunit [Pseudomonas gregormendelii]MBN3966157.1 fimbrial assembly protein [Pseudomonas gregormendelii]
MFKTLITTVLLLTSTFALAARQEHEFEVSVRVPTLQFYVIPTDPGWMHQEQVLPWDVRRSTLGGLRKEFDVLNDGGAVSAKLVSAPYLSNGNARDNIQLKVKFNGVELDALTYKQVVSAQDAKVGSRVQLEIVPQMTAGGYKPGSYYGNVNMIFNAAAPGA